jgi:collagen triple helix repeat protein/IPT/TIG domain-containing protein
MIVRRPWLTYAAAILSLVVFLPAPAVAQAAGLGQLEVTALHPDILNGQLEVTAVHPDVPNGQLVIEGTHFGRRAGSVSLAGLELSPILSWSNSQIIVPLPPFPAGSYLLTVARGRAIREFNVFGVALGGVGPKGDRGDKGEKGDRGDRGDRGEDGATGADGAPGAAGATGAQGPQGDVGPIGPQGPQGETGSSGATGPSGPAGPQGGAGPIGPAGPQGNVGPTGATGPAGPQGVPGLSGFQVVTITINIPATTRGGFALGCPSGKTAIGGGVRPASPTLPTTVVASYPQNATVWNTQVDNTSDVSQSYTFYTLCATVIP